MATLLSDSRASERPSHDLPPGSVDTTIGFGEFLRCARERSGRTLQQIANETKIPQRHLEALEHDDMPAPTDLFYRRAEIRTYARAVHSDERQAVALFDRALQASLVREPAAKPSTGRVPLLSASRLLIVAVVVLAAVVLGRVIGKPEAVFLPGGQVRAADSSAPQPPAAAPQALQKDARSASEPAAGKPLLSLSDRAADTQRDASGVAAVAGTDLRVGTDPGAPRPAGDPFTELVVTTDPVGARVTVNGVGWGIAPVTIRYLAPGVKRIRITKEGYATEERELQLTEGDPKALEVRLTSVQ
jgi:cytoskeleton protein RodZ